MIAWRAPLWPFFPLLPTGAAAGPGIAAEAGWTMPVDPEAAFGPSREQTRFAGAVAVALVVSGVALTPIANLPLYQIPGYMTAFGAFMLVINLLLAALLFSRGTIERDAGSVRLGATYFFIAIIFLPLMAAFPGGFVSFQLIGGKTSAVWLWAFWHAGFGLGIIRYALSGESRPAKVRDSMIGVIALVVALAVLATRGLPYLPSMLADGHTLFTGFGAYVPPAILVILAAALLLVVTRTAPSRERLWLMVGLVAACFDVWLTYRGTSRFSLGWYVAKGGSLVTSLSMLISLLYDVTALRHRLILSNRMLLGIANRDGLTGLANRRRFDETIDTEWRRARRDQQPLTLLMVDVDYFKSYNDRYGHIQGDACLRQIAGLLQEMGRRPADCVARYGGEEFAVILPGTGAAGANELAQQIHGRLAALALPHEASRLGRVTVSIGQATILPSAALEQAELLATADHNLYEAKASGRNQSVHS